MSRKYESTRGRSSTTGLSTTTQRQQTPLSKPQVREYDKDGYHVIESTTPTSRMVIKYNDKEMSYTYNSQVKYSGPYSKDFIDSMARTMSYGYGNADKILDDFLSDSDIFFDEFYPRYPRNYIGSESYYSDGNSPRRTSYVYHERHTKSSGCCGCFLWAIVLLAVLCLVMYGMSEIGESIIDFFKNLF